ncbi:hypothetical protein BDV95DRAFT_573414 [Massariosphaeria phaeospora]|uniref:Uncharacterized protein n=1 Tax=Massariosphaeria phaeospora TaxID=100035 RepID=A0A7C8MNG5_9PLEO|nr:hypothetical protein BDV95DRAFT_573414 [Massariosphaeria phaeospora]
MLGLRPRLKARPSLLDLVRKKNIDEISQEPARLSPLQADHRPLRIPLPSSPSVTPQLEVTSPPPYSVKEDTERELKKTAKMAPKQQQTQDSDEDGHGSVYSVSGYVLSIQRRSSTDVADPSL